MEFNKLLKENYEKWKNKEYIYEKKNENDEFEAKTFGKFIEDTYSLANYLLNNNLKNEKIIIFGNNSYNLMISDLAVTAFVGQSIVISKDSKETSIIKMINNIDAKAIIYDDKKQDIVEKIKDECDIKLIKMSDFSAILEKVQMFNLPEKDINECSKIVFSSGTTGPSKGIMLSIKNIFSGYEDLRRRVVFTENDKDYLFLPLNHTYANIYNFYYSLIDGYSIYLASSTSNIAKELLEVNPTIFCAVPLIYQKMIDAYGENLSIAFGKNIKYLFCGGAPCSKEMRQAYKNFNFLQAYALSETSSSFSIDYPDKKDDYSCGTIFESIDAKIFEPDGEGVGEIIVKGDNVFLGYIDETLTKKAFDENGYFHTGDLGYIENNKLYLKGRKKKILVGSNGENIDVEVLTNYLISLNSKIKNVKLYMNKDNQLTADIYVLEITNDENFRDTIEKYNDNVLKYEKILEYNLIEDKVENRLK